MDYWKKLTKKEISKQIFSALDANVDYENRVSLGVPASYLDEKVFNRDDNFLQNAPFLSAMIDNSNHIGCHTTGESEEFFAGTQKIEKELIHLLAEDVLLGDKDMQDGYVASGGTEANIQAIWIYRNYFIREVKAKQEEICVLCSNDSHYSMPKAANLMNIDLVQTPVDDKTREIDASLLRKTIKDAKSNGKKYFIVVANMMTTMFGSVDDVNLYVNELEYANVDFKIHIDAAFGGFVYPFSANNELLTFKNKNISSFTLDAHKMVQAPFGTGIFICRKGLINYVLTEDAQYVQGQDNTLIGSRSGSNAISVWMILMTYGPHDWFEKIHILNYRASWLCKELRKLNIEFFRNPDSNIVTIRANEIDADIVKHYRLVPDTHDGNPNWYKIVIMDHVHIDHLKLFIDSVKQKLNKK